MDAKTDYTGTHKVVLPTNFLNSVDAAVELYEDDIAGVAADLSVAGMPSRRRHRFLAFVFGLLIALLPGDWLSLLG